jgi:hypothetical protein
MAIKEHKRLLTHSHEKDSKLSVAMIVRLRMRQRKITEAIELQLSAFTCDGIPLHLKPRAKETYVAINLYPIPNM